MRLEFIGRVEENSILGKSILTYDGSVLLRAGVALTSQYINKLQKLGVYYVYIEDERLDDVDVEDERLLELKQMAMKSMNSVFKNINNSNSKQASESLAVVEDLIEYVIECGDVSKSLCDIKTYDNYTYVHSLDTGIMTTFLGESLGFNQNELIELGKGGILHDIGKTKISSSIINKKGKLTEEEYLEIKKHPKYGRDILSKNMSISEIVLKAVIQHHERINGSGYPYGLSGNEISKYGKVVGICDVYEAVSNDRIYRKKFTPNDAYELILGGSGTMFDEEMVRKFKETFAIYPLGCCVRLSNGVEGYVVSHNKNFPDRPVIRVIYDPITKAPIPFYELDLVKKLDVTIVSVV